MTKRALRSMHGRLASIRERLDEILDDTREKLDTATDGSHRAETLQERVDILETVAADVEAAESALADLVQ